MDDQQYCEQSKSAAISRLTEIVPGQIDGRAEVVLKGLWLRLIMSGNILLLGLQRFGPDSELSGTL